MNPVMPTISAAKMIKCDFQCHPSNCNKALFAPTELFWDPACMAVSNQTLGNHFWSNNHSLEADMTMEMPDLPRNISGTEGFVDPLMLLSLGPVNNNFVISNHTFQFPVQPTPLCWGVCHVALEREETHQVQQTCFWQIHEPQSPLNTFMNGLLGSLHPNQNNSPSQCSACTQPSPDSDNTISHSI